MNKVALGGYMLGLRDEQELTPADVVVRLKPFLGNVNVTTIWRIETGRMKVNGVMLLALLQVLRGDTDEALTILTSDDMSAVEGERRGRATARRTTLTDHDLAAMHQLDDEQRARLAAILAERRARLDGA